MPEIELELTKTIEQNAARYFESAKKSKDVMNIRYRVEFRPRLTPAGNYLNLRPMDVQRFNRSYENMLAYYAGRVPDQANGAGTMPAEVLVAQQRFVRYKERMEKRIAL